MVSGWCPCVPLGRRQSSTQQQQQQQQQQPPSSSRAPFTVSGATDRADMVQMFYYENRGKCCKKLLRYNGYPNKKQGKEKNAAQRKALLPMYHNKSGVSIFNRHRLFLTSLPCLSSLAALNSPYFPRERCIVDSNKLSDFFFRYQHCTR
ncbi:hypothetical protein ACFW04_003986 [Cataglyphis niger]